MQNIPYFKISMGDAEYKNVKSVLDSGWLTTGKYAQKLEHMVAEFTGVKYALAVNSCTSALHLALDAVGVKAGDKVFLPSLTFAATAEVITYFGAIPILLDCDYATRLVTPRILSDAIQKHADCRVAMLVHYAGHSLDMDVIKPLCQDNNITIIEDAAHALPTQCGDKTIGTIGDLTCFSFYANKTMTTGEGGLITTDNEDYAKRIQIMRMHGMDRDVWDRYASDKPKWQWDVIAPGYKYNMPDLNAAVGVGQLQRLQKMRNERQRVATLYMQHLAGVPTLDLPKITIPYAHHAWHIYAVVVNHPTITRNAFIDALQQQGIGTAVHWRPIHALRYYKDTYGFDVNDYPNTEKYWQGCVSLPLFDGLTDAQVVYICDTIKHILQ